MTREWTDALARKIFWAAFALLAVLLAVIAGRVAARYELWRPPDVGVGGTVLLWTALALALLFGLDRGIPREGVWGFRLYVLRKVLVAAAFATIAAMVYLG